MIDFLVVLAVIWNLVGFFSLLSFLDKLAEEDKNYSEYKTWIVCILMSPLGSLAVLLTMIMVTVCVKLEEMFLPSKENFWEWLEEEEDTKEE